ncbi:hypothetical protein [Pseudomonas viridiflava]|uniref:hypothetical protein n=1 Tax=Pseudomonas viridiflava TaxID=33069 RepID=UPI002EA6FA85|nr:hypothetical protein [Pseudomonas viridiflava]
MSADAMLGQLMTDDELYCAKNLKIRAKNAKIIPFVWNDAQRIIHAKLEAQLADTGMVRAIILKGRKQGASTYIGARFYKKTSMGFGLNTMILTHVASSTSTLFAMVKTFYELSDDTLRPTIKASSATELSFSKLRSGYKVATAGSKNTGRGDTIQLLHGSEMGFWENAEDIRSGLGEAVPDEPGTEIVFESTANGLGNDFHRTWNLAIAKKSNFIAIFIPWFLETQYRRAVPDDFELSDDDLEYQETYDLDDEQMAWRQNKIISSFGEDEDRFNQEFPASPDMAFLKVGHKALINTLKVAKARKQEIRHVQRIGAHVVGLDPARGGDTSTFIHRQGRVAWGITRNHIPDTMAVAGQAARMLMDDKTIRMMFIDIGGLGAGIYDRLVELNFGDRVTAVNFGSSASDSRKYANKRCEMWGEMAAWIGSDITPCIPDEDQLHGDLTSVSKDKYTSDGQLKLESKDEVKKKLGRSPDDGDALALTFAEPVSADDIHIDDWKAKLMRRNARKSAMSA